MAASATLVSNMEKNMTNETKEYHLTINDVVQIVFIILKCAKLVNWSWWAVLIPAWIQIGYAAIVFIYALVCVVLENREEKKKK